MGHLENSYDKVRYLAMTTSQENRDDAFYGFNVVSIKARRIGKTCREEGELEIKYFFFKYRRSKRSILVAKLKY